MDIEATFPLMTYLNLGVSDRRRQTAKRQFGACGLEVVRQPAINGGWLRSAHGFPNRWQRACAMTKRLALRRARFAKASAVLIFEDDVVLAPDFRTRLENTELPDDWGMFFLGCLHMEEPEPAGDGLVRVRRGYWNHAFAVRSPYYRSVAAAIRGRARFEDETLGPSDVLIADLQEEIPTYALSPSVAWQASGYSHVRRRMVSYQREDGSEVRESDALGTEPSCSRPR